MKKIVLLISFWATFAAPSISNAGFAGGPYFLWFNLSNNKYIDDVINKNLSDGEDCGDPDMKIIPAPDWINRELIEKALIQENKGSIKVLDDLVRRKYPQYAAQGLDGVIVYTDSPNPRFLNFVRGRKVILKDNLAKPSDEKAIWRKFCLMVPPITRPA